MYIWKIKRILTRMEEILEMTKKWECLILIRSYSRLHNVNVQCTSSSCNFEIFHLIQYDASVPSVTDRPNSVPLTKVQINMSHIYE